MTTDKIRIDFIESLIKEFGQFAVYKHNYSGSLREYLDKAISFCEFKVPKQLEIEYDAFI